MQIYTAFNSNLKEKKNKTVKLVFGVLPSYVFLVPRRAIHTVTIEDAMALNTQSARISANVVLSYKHRAFESIQHFISIIYYKGTSPAMLTLCCKLHF